MQLVSSFNQLREFRYRRRSSPPFHSLGPCPRYFAQPGPKAGDRDRQPYGQLRGVPAPAESLMSSTAPDDQADCSG
jgi:hypothetical protein